MDMDEFTPEISVKLIREVMKLYPGCPILVGCEDEPALFAANIMKGIKQTQHEDAKKASNFHTFAGGNKVCDFTSTAIYMIMASNPNIKGGVGISNKRGSGHDEMRKLAQLHFQHKTRISKSIICDTNHDLWGFNNKTDYVLKLAYTQLKNATLDPTTGVDSGKKFGNDDIYSSVKLAYYSDTFAREPNHVKVAHVASGMIFNPAQRTVQRKVVDMLEDEKKKLEDALKKASLKENSSNNNAMIYHE
jgi:hypothetical protein